MNVRRVDSVQKKDNEPAKKDRRTDKGLTENG